jgi:hypothetical protein
MDEGARGKGNKYEMSQFIESLILTPKPPYDQSNYRHEMIHKAGLSKIPRGHTKSITSVETRSATIWSIEKCKLTIEKWCAN